MKVIFLDLDGVLNTSETINLPGVNVELHGISIGFNQLDKNAVNQLNRVTDITGAKIVISSSWRVGCNTAEKMEILCKHLHNEGVTGEIIGRTATPDEYGQKVSADLIFCWSRASEIQAWLDQNPDVEKFVVVDDMSDMGHLTDNHLVQTQFENGITWSESDQMIDILL